MRIALCTVQVPFVRGGAENLCDNLHKELIKRDYEVEYIKIPFKWYPPQEIINNCIVWRLLDLSESNGLKIDGVIATKFPSYLVNHTNKVVWLIHQHRSAYDKANTEFDDMITHGKIGEIVRSKIHKIDNKYLKDSNKIYTISQNVTNRLWRFNAIRGETLYPPPPHFGQYYCNDFDDYIFYPSRLDSLKRQDLLIRSMKYIKSNLRLKIAGSGPQLNYYRELSNKCKVNHKIDFLGRVSDEELLDLYANAFCVAYTPSDEDLGYVTIEGFLSKKPVITCIDSGGSLEFVENFKNGYITEPDPKKIAKSIDDMYMNNNYKKMGENGFDKISRMNLSWDRVIKNLVGQIE